MIEKKDMEARRAQLVAARDQQAAQVNAIVGRIEELDHWLAKLDEPKPEAAPA